MLLIMVVPGSTPSMLWWYPQYVDEYTLYSFYQYVLLIFLVVLLYK